MDANVRLLEDRVRRAVERLRRLAEERRRIEEELQVARRSIARIGEEATPGAWPVPLERVTEELEEAIRDLREE